MKYISLFKMVDIMKKYTDKRLAILAESINVNIKALYTVAISLNANIIERDSIYADRKQPVVTNALTCIIDDITNLTPTGKKAIEKLKAERTYDDIIYMTPDGAVLDQAACNQLSLKQNLIILCGHYKGVDQRIRDHYVTKEISIGSYVLSGGELAAAIVVDAVVRLIPGVLNDETSALTDSFQDNLLAPPVYTRPPEFMGMKVPDVLLSGNPKDVAAWREAQAYERTKDRRPDLLEE